MDYLTQYEGDRPQASWDAIKIVKVAKGESPGGFCRFNINGAPKRYDDDNWDEMIADILPIMGKQIRNLTTVDTYLIPIPNSDMTMNSGDNHRIVDLARLFLSGYQSLHAAPRVDLLPSLCWSAPKTPSRTTPGRRSPDLYRGIFRLRSTFDRPVILFDDVYTSGSQAKAAIQYLKGKGITTLGVMTLGKTVHTPSDKPLSYRQDTCTVEADPFDLAW